MQSILERIIPDKSQSTDSKKNLFQTILTKLQDPTKKISFIKEAISYLLSLEDSTERLQLIHYLVVYIQDNRYDCYTFDEIKNIIEYNEELAIIVLFANLFIKTSRDNSKVFQLKNVFLKHIKKDEAYWFTDIIRDFLAKKAIQEATASSQPTAQNSGAAVLQGFQYEKHLLQVNIAFDFFTENPSFAPSNFDIKEVFLKWLLTIKTKTDSEKQLLIRVIEHLLDICRNNYLFYMTCFKFLTKALRHKYTNADTFECHYAVYNFIEHTDPKALDEMMRPLVVGEPIWGPIDWLNIFKNLWRMGLSDNVGVTFLALSKGLENIRAYGVLIRVQEEIIPGLIRPLTVKGWQQSALDILNFFILQGPVNAGLVQKIQGKLFSTVKDICKGEISQFSSDLISFVYHLKLKYAQSSSAEEIEQEYSNFINECQIDPIRIDTHRYSIVPWAAFDAQQKVSHPGDKPKYRGLVNLGNTCYMNSFVQALFMTKLFRYRVLSLVDSVQKMYNNSENQQQQQQQQQQKEAAEKNGEKTETPKQPNQVSTVNVERKKAVSLFQLQKLFAFMTASERDAITPNFLKATLPLHFKTSHHQEDSSEFGRIYLDDLEKSLVNTEERDLIRELFTGEIVSYITCKDCGTKYRKMENFMDLSLNFESRDPNISYELPDLIHKNFEPVEFKDDNQYFCEKCQNKSSLAIKTHIPTKIPPILILTINRFYFDTQTFQRVKILSHVNIMEELDMTQEKEDGISEEIKYDLYAIVVHRGMTLDYGHYYSTAKEEVESPVWVLFDDSNAMSLEKIDPFAYVKNNKQDSPYILFYQARDYYNKYSGQYKDFKLSTSLKKVVEQDNMVHLKEIDNNAKLLASITALNVPQHIMTGPYNFNKKDDDDENDYSKPNDFPGGNSFIM